MFPSLLLRSAATAAPTRINRSTFWSDLPALIDKARIQCGVPGMSIAVLHKNELIFAEGFGKRNEKNDPFTPETLSPIASVTKSFTAMALAQLVAEGKMDWDTTPISTYLPEFALKDPVLTSQVTLADLLSHRTGVPGEVSVPFLCSKAPLNELLSRLRFSDQPSKLGAKTIYNNAMYTVAGEAGARVAGMPYEDLVRQKVLEPLGLHNSGFTADERWTLANHTQPFETESFEAAQRGEFTRIVQSEDYTRLAAAGSMYSNVLDLVRWGKTVLDLGQLDGKQVLDKASVEQVLKPHTIMDLSSKRPTGFSPFMAYGLGWTVDSYKGQPLYWHDGGLAGVTSYLGIMPDSDLVVATLINRLPVQLGSRLLYMIADALLDLPKTYDWIEASVKDVQEETDLYIGLGVGKHLPERMADKPMTLPLSAFEGRYTHPLYETISVRSEDDKLFFTIWDKEYQVEHYHQNVFLVKMNVTAIPCASLLEFKTDADGSAVAIVVSEANIEYKRQ
ncbi:hypothetical protein EMPS_02648 [Entomortierella parvispora]|uniref:Beta-lactamase-related domain-containing protein n=1 Tax=Entomortierella parvispora TaxID=205924 RepID=A0A9P3LTW0_9FUNG|nr:hypothetical protein EMPS_02648 [Entomortierella parvispora]